MYATSRYTELYCVHSKSRVSFQVTLKLHRAKRNRIKRDLPVYVPCICREDVTIAEEVQTSGVRAMVLGYKCIAYLVQMLGEDTVY